MVRVAKESDVPAVQAEEIEIKNVGPIADYVFKISPGVNVLTGANEVGKSTVINGVSALIGNDAEISVRDGQKSGMISGFGTTLVVGKKLIRSGDPDVENAEEGGDLSDFVEPRAKTDDAKRKERVKILLSLTKTKISIADFYQVLPAEYRGEIVDAWIDDDPVVMAGKVKRGMEELARKWEAKKDTTQGEIDAARNTFEGVETEGFNESAVQSEYSEALRKEQVLQTKEEESIRVKVSIERAQKELEAVGGGDLQKRLEETQKAIELDRESIAATEKSIDEAAESIRQLERQLETLKATYVSRCSAKDQADRLLKSHQDNLRDVSASITRSAELVEATNRAIPDPPTAEEFEAARKVRVAAWEKLQNVQKVKIALEAKQKHAELRKVHADQISKAEVFRGAARQVYSVLSNALKCRTLQMIEGELYYVEGERKEPFDRLSDGKRYQVAIAEIAHAVKSHSGKMSVLPLRQHAWEGLGEKNRNIVAHAAIENNIGLVTAQMALDDNEKLSSFYYEPTDK